MARRSHNIDRLLADWAYDPESVKVRLARGTDGREILQMRVDMGVLQLEVLGRPDGERPHGFQTYYDYLLGQELQDQEFELDERQCLEVDREFVQFYHRRVCWLTLQRYDRAIADADHTLALMDFTATHSPSEQWTLAHEQYRPFVVFHRIQAVALEALDGEGPENAVHELNVGLEQLRGLMESDEELEYEADNELLTRLAELRDSVRDQYSVGKTLYEQLQDAVAREEYELAARLRDELAKRRKRDPEMRY
jgi:hypothetical protein